MQSAKKILATLGIFSIFALLVFSIYSRTPGLFTGDDPYYHAYRAAALWRSETPNMPVYTTFQTHPVTFYIGYYWSMAPFTAGFNGNNFDSIILGSKIYHSLLIGFLYASFFAITWKLLKSGKYALTAVTLLFVSSELFVFRSFIPRPHVMSIILVILAYYFAVRNHKKSIFILNIISPFTYSTSFFTVVPGIVYAVVAKKWWPAILSCGGLLVGILIRPDSWNYFYNAYGLHLLSIFRTTILGQAGPGELKSGGLILLHEPWIFAYVAILGYALIYFLTWRNNRQTLFFKWSIESKYTLVLSFLFYIPFMFVVRTIEYTLPFAILAILFVWKEHLLFFMRRFTSIRFENNTSKAQQIFINIPQHILKTFYEYKKILLFVCILSLVSLGVTRLTLLRYTAEHQNDLTPFVALTDYLKEHSVEGDLVMYQDFALHSKLVFFRTNNHFPVGMDPIFLYEYDQKLYWLWYHIALSEDICEQKICAQENTLSMYDALHERLKAKYFLLDYIDSDHEAFEQGSSTRKKLESDSRFELVHGKVEEDQLALYKIQ